MNYIAHTHQKFAEEHVLNNVFAGLFLDMGLGKTVITLSALEILINQWFEVSKVLIIAPKRVVESVWPAEIEKWDHINLKCEIVLGTQAQRIAALNRPADIHVINRENVPWLIKHYQTSFPFDTIVIDELSSFKSPSSQRFRSLRMVRPLVNRIIALTGTPAPNGLIDLWSQLYLIDRGERLGKNVTEYRRTYFESVSQQGFIVYKYGLKKGCDKLIYDKIGDICISMKSKDYLNLPATISNVIDIKMDKDIKLKYDLFEEEQVMILKDQEITAVNAAVLTGKLLQFAAGAIYGENRSVHHLHDLKLDALADIIDEAQGQNILLAYSFKHDAERIKKRFKFARELKNQKDVDDWNNGKIPLLIMHPASGGHGLNLQFGGHIIVWFSLNWSLELYQQFNARLPRPGQTKAVIINHILIKGTMDVDVYKALLRKDGVQSALMNAVKARINKYL